MQPIQSNPCSQPSTTLPLPSKVSSLHEKIRWVAKQLITKIWQQMPHQFYAKTKMMRPVIPAAQAILFPTSKQCQAVLSTDMTAKLPNDPAVILKKLPNGLTYYIQHNEYPAKEQASLRLVVRVGSAYEKEGQEGLAHFVEHTASEETEHFQRNEVKDYLESIGSAYGPDNNAATGFDKTYYMIDIALDKEQERLDQVLLILSEIASKAVFPENVVEKERGPILDEAQHGKDVNQRYVEKIFSVLFEGTPYANRFPIGLEGVIRSTDGQGLRHFYETWYRPDNMAIVAVGDFDPALVENLIHKHFAEIPSPSEPTPRPTFEVTPHEDAKYVCFSDKEATISKVCVFYKIPEPEPSGYISLQEAKEFAIRQLILEMFNERLFEISQSDHAPFFEASLKSSSPMRNLTLMSLSTIHKEGYGCEALKNLLLEVKRVHDHGFLETELERAKAEYIAGLDHAFEEKDNRTTQALIKSYLDHFIDGDEISSIEDFVSVQKRFLSEITLEEINCEIMHLLSEANRVISSYAPEKEGLLPINEQQLQNVVEEVQKATPTPYIDTKVSKALMTEIPKPGAIVTTEHCDKVDVTIFTLENGMKVYVKPTKFDNDLVIINSFAQKGKHDALIEDRTSWLLANAVAVESGLAGLTPTELGKVLTGKELSWQRNIDNHFTTLQISTTTKDLETSLQLMHLSFMNPGYRPKAFDKTIELTRELIMNRNNNPTVIFNKAVLAHVTQNHPVYRPLEVEDLKEANYDKSIAFHRDCFHNPANYTTVIVGNVDTKAIKPLLEQYCASISQVGPKQEEHHYPDIPLPEGITHQDIYAGKEPAIKTYIAFPSTITGDLVTRFQDNLTCCLLRARLLEKLRSEMAQTYGVSVNYDPPQVSELTDGQTEISFSCEPENVEVFKQTILNEIRIMQEEGPTEQELQNLKEIQRHHRQKALGSSRSWVNLLSSYRIMGWDIERIYEFDDNLKALAPEVIKETVNRLFNPHHYCSLTLYPKNMEPTGEEKRVQGASSLPGSSRGE